MAQFWNPQGQPQAGSAPTPSPSQPAATQSAEEAAYWAAPASTRAYMLRPGSAEWNRRQADQQVNDAQFAAAGITDPFGYALRGAGSAAPRNAQPSAPTLGTNQPSPVQLPPQGMGQPPAGMGMNNFSPVQLPSQAPTAQPLMPPSFGVTQQQPTQQGSVLGPMTPKPYQSTNFSPAPRMTQTPGAPAGGGYRSNPAFAAYSRRRGL